MINVRLRLAVTADQIRYFREMTQIKGNQAAPRKRVSKQDWLDAALALLRTGGIEAVRVERLSEKLGVAKSGFHYLFSDRDDLHNPFLDQGLQLDGRPLMEERRFAEAKPEERLKIVAEVVDRANLGRYDFAIRQWARNDPRVRRIWRKEINKRLAHIRSLFSDLGFTGDELEMRVRSFVAYQVGERDLFEELSTPEHAMLRQLRLQLLLKP